ncbi:MFS transporter [Nocardioides sp.]|uniref:MFS transporter n=1 Tax=Nocardioides sp. TaxID=35761 RepID=UPI00272144D3|nr:MFS transporter [Nocardioides sp.]MDO9456493.1 MFS transporter [Nocardioides sp.]
MTLTVEPTTIGAARRWSMLGASTVAQAASAVAAHGPAFLIPALRQHEGLSLAEAGVVAAAPTVGVMLTLVAWGMLTDRRGERLVLVLGLALTAVFSGLAVLADGLVLLSASLFLAGAAAASANAASGRVVVGWFPPHRRGLAMGIRQMAQPVGVAVAAVSMAVIADAHGIGAALLVPTVAAAVAAVVVLLVVVDPPRPPAVEGGAANPYRADSFLARIHGVSVLLVVPQFVVWTFSLVWLVEERGWSPAAAGTLVAVAQVVAAFGRIAAGQLSDLVGSRMRPLRWVAVAASATMALLGLAAGLDLSVAVPLLVIATVLTVADNGLAFTAVAERAGPFWSGRALGLQNTAQFLTSALVPPLGGLLVTHTGYAATFAVAALLPAVAVGLVPVRGEEELH